MKSQEYKLFPQQDSHLQGSYRQENLFSPQQNWRIPNASKAPPVVKIQTQPTFLSQQIVQTPGRISQVPIQYVLSPQQLVPVITQPLITQQQVVNSAVLQNNQQGSQQTQTTQQQQVPNSNQRQGQDKKQENKQPQQQQSNPIQIYKQQLIQEQVRSEHRNEKQKQLEQKIHQEILSQSKRLNPAQKIQQTQVPLQQTKSLLQSIQIHHNEKDLHIQKTSQNQIFEQQNLQASQQIQPTPNLLVSRSYVQIPQQVATVQYLSPLVTSQVRILQPPLVPTSTTLLTSQVKVVQPLKQINSPTGTRLIPTKASKIKLSQIGGAPFTRVSTVLTPKTQILSQSIITQSPIGYSMPLVLNQQQYHSNTFKVSQIINSPKGQVNEFGFNSGFKSFQSDRDNFQRNPDFIKSIDGGFGTERITNTNKNEKDLNVHQQQVREIIQQSKYLLQNDISTTQEELNKQYQGLKQYEKQSLQNRLDQDKFFQDFEMRRMQFNKKLQQCSQSSHVEINEIDQQRLPQSNLYLIPQQRVVSQVPLQNASQIAVSQNISLQSNHLQQQNIQASQQVPIKVNIARESQTLKQPILTEYEQSLIIQQQSTSNFPNSARNQNENHTSQPQLRDNKFQDQTNCMNNDRTEIVPQLAQKEQKRETEKQQQNFLSNDQDEEAENNQSYQQPEPSISNQINQQDFSRSSTVHQVIEKDLVYSQQHQEFKQKFLKSKDQFYQEKSQLSDRSKQLQQVQEQENKDAQLAQQQQQQISVKGQANQQLIDQIASTNNQKSQNRYQLLDEESNHAQITQSQQEQASNLNQQNQIQGQQQIQIQNIQQIQQQYLQSRGQANEQLLNEINHNQEEEQQEQLDSEGNQEQEQNNSENQEGENQMVDLQAEQQQYLQNRGQINQLFMQSLENKYQQQFEQEEEEDDYDEQQLQQNDNHQQQGDEQIQPDDNYQEQENALLDQDEDEYNQFDNQILSREKFQSEEEYLQYLHDQQQYFDEINQQQILTPDHFENEEEYNQYILQIQQIQQQSYHLQQIQQQYLISRGLANEQLIQQFYQNQQNQANAHQQMMGEDLINFEDYSNQENLDKQNQNIQDMNQEFESDHDKQIHLKLYNQQMQQQLLNQQINQQYAQQISLSQQQMANSPSNYDDEERLVMLREQQLLQEKRQRDQERQQQIQQIEQEELIKISQNSPANRQN